VRVLTIVFCAWHEFKPYIRIVAWLGALFLMILGAKFWVVRMYGTGIPYWDQRDEAALLFKPWLEGHLTLRPAGLYWRKTWIFGAGCAGPCQRSRPTPPMDADIPGGVAGVGGCRDGAEF
jgi:hypothetical protein